MRRIKTGILAVSAVVTGLLIGQTAIAAALTPQVDFRSEVFSAADHQTSFHANVDGIGFTIEAFTYTSGQWQATSMWWDNKDGIGIRSGFDQDEIDENQMLRLTFDDTIGLSDLYVSDLFSDEHYDGQVYDEAGAYQIDGGDKVVFDAGELAGTDGDKSNGEARISLSKVVPVNVLTLTAPDMAGAQNYSIIGFTDPPIPNDTLSPNEVPESGLVGLGVLLAGLGMTGFARRRGHSRK